MTVSATSNVKTYTGNGSSVNFATVFQFIDEGDIKVYLDGVLKTITTHYTVSGGDGSTGTVTFLSAPAADVAVVLQRFVEYVQETDYTDFDGNPAATTETQFDLVVMQCQQLSDATERALSVAVGSDFSAEITVTGNEGKYLRINDAGDAFDFTSTIDTETVSVSSFAETVVDDTSAANMRQTLLFPAQSASKRGSILVQNDSDNGYEQITSQGTYGQVFTSTGPDALPIFTTIGTSLTLLSTQSASTSATINFDSTYITSTYKKYVIEMISVVLTATGVPTISVSQDNGSNIKGGASDYAYQGNYTQGAGNNAFGSTGATNISFTNDNPVTGTGLAVNAQIQIYDPSNTTTHKSFVVTMADKSSTSFRSTLVAAKYQGDVNALNYIRLSVPGTTFASGTFKLYGVS